MKRLLPIMLLLLAPVFLLAQIKKVKLYAYQQAVLPGAVKTTIDESGNSKAPPPKTSSSNFIYLEAPSMKKIEPLHIWIKGELYDLRTEKPKLPVLMQYVALPLKKTDTLVKATSNPVMQLLPVPAKNGFTPSAAVKKKIRSNEIVVHTIEKGKNCYYYLDRIKILEPVALQ